MRRNENWDEVKKTVKKHSQHDHDEHDFVKFNEICDNFNVVEKLTHVFNRFLLQIVKARNLKKLACDEEISLINVSVKLNEDILIKKITTSSVTRLVLTQLV